MPREDDLHAHLSGAAHDLIKVIHLKPKEHAISVRPVARISDGAVVMVDLEAM